MLMAELEYDRAYEAYLDAAEAFKTCRDGYIPYLDDKEAYEEEVVRLMNEMDAAEDAFLWAKMEYYEFLDEEYGRSYYWDTYGEPYPRGTLDEFKAYAAQAKKDYDDLALGRVPFMGDKEDLASELERRREEWRKAVELCDDEYDRVYFDKLRKKMTNSQKKQ